MTTLPEVVRACLKDPALKAKLIADPAGFLAEHGLEVPAGITVKVVENTPSVFHLVLPQAPSTTGELSDDELAAAAGGWGGDPNVTANGACPPVTA